MGNADKISASSGKYGQEFYTIVSLLLLFCIRGVMSLNVVTTSEPRAWRALSLFCSEGDREASTSMMLYDTAGPVSAVRTGGFKCLTEE